MESRFQFRPSLIALAAAAVLAGGSMGVHAAPSVLLTATGNVADNASPGTDLLDPYPYTTSGGDFFASPSSATGSLFFHTYGFTASPNYFGARVSGAGAFYGKTSATYSDSITNTSGVAQNILFSFNVDSGSVDLSGSGVGFADLLLSLSFNNTEVASSHSRVDTAATACLATGTGVLSSYMTCNDVSSASGNGGSFVVPYLLAAGDTLTIDYDIVSEVSGEFEPGGASEYCAGYGGEAQRVANAVNEEGGPPGISGCQYFNALSRSGDPAGFNAFVPAQFGIAAEAVPEPGTLVLAAVAVGGLAAARRRRREAALPAPDTKVSA
jgi:hypothetical protein